MTVVFALSQALESTWIQLTGNSFLSLIEQPEGRRELAKGLSHTPCARVSKVIATRASYEYFWQSIVMGHGEVSSHLTHAESLEVAMVMDLTMTYCLSPSAWATPFELSMVRQGQLVSSAVSSRYLALGWIAAAVEIDSEAVARLLVDLDKADERVLTALGNLGDSLRRAGRYSEAERVERGVLASLAGQASERALIARSNLAVTLSALGRLDQALAIEFEIVELASTLPGPANTTLVTALCNISETLSQLGRMPEAMAAIERAYEASTAIDSQGLQALTVEANRCQVLSRIGNAEEAEQEFTRLIGAIEDLHGEHHPLADVVRSNLGHFLAANGRQEEGLELLAAVFDRRAKGLGDAHPETLASALGLAQLFCEVGETGLALRTLRSTKRSADTTLGPEHPQSIATAQGLAAALSKTGEADEAREIARAALSIGRPLLGELHPTILALHEVLSGL